MCCPDNANIKRDLPDHPFYLSPVHLQHFEHPDNALNSCHIQSGSARLDRLHLS